MTIIVNCRILHVEICHEVFLFEIISSLNYLIRYSELIYLIVCNYIFRHLFSSDNKSLRYCARLALTSGGATVNRTRSFVSRFS